MMQGADAERLSQVSDGCDRNGRFAGIDIESRRSYLFAIFFFGKSYAILGSDYLYTNGR